MAKITSAATLTRDMVTIETSTRDITLTKTGALSDDGVSLLALYSYLKSVWRITDFDIAANGASSGTTINLANTTNVLPGMKITLSGGAGVLNGDTFVESVATTSIVVNTAPSTPLNGSETVTFINHLIEYPFPLVAITPEQFIFSFDWTMVDDTSRYLIRDAGWQEETSAGVTNQQWTGVITLGTIDTVTGVTSTDASQDTTFTVSSTTGITAGMEVRVLSGGTGTIPADTKVVSVDNLTTLTLSAATTATFNGSEIILFGDRVYYSFYDTVAETFSTPADFQFLGPVNEPVKTLDVGTSLDVTDNVLFLYIRTEAKTHGKSTSVDIGIPEATDINFQVYRFPLSESTDLNYLNASSIPYASDQAIEAADGANGKYDAVVVSKTAAADGAGNSTTLLLGDTTGIFEGSFVYGPGIPVNTQVTVGGITANTSVVLTKATTTTYAGTENINFVNGPHIAYLNADASSADIYSSTTDLVGTPYNFGVIINARDGSFGGTAGSGSLSGSLSLFELYNWVQYKLRQSIDIDADGDHTGTSGTQTGQLSDQLVQFVGSQLQSLKLDTDLTAVYGPGNLDRATTTDGTGVALFNFDSAEIGNIALRDNTWSAGTSLRVFPTIASGTITFNANLLEDTNSSFTMFYTYTRQYSVSDMSWTQSAGSTGSLGSTGGNIPTVTDGDYIDVSGFSDSNLNGVYLVNSTTTPTQEIVVTRIDDVTLPASEGAQTGGTNNFRFNPVNSPDAVIVTKANGTDEIQAKITVGGTVQTIANGGLLRNSDSKFQWDYAYTSNTQPDEAAGENRQGDTDVPVTIRAVGTDKAQWVSTPFTIGSGTGQDFSITAPLERNYAP